MSSLLLRMCIKLPYINLYWKFIWVWFCIMIFFWWKATFYDHCDHRTSFEIWSLKFIKGSATHLSSGWIAYDQCSCLDHYIPQFFFSYPSLVVILKLASNVRLSTCLYLVICFPLCPESVMHKNPQRHKIIHGMRPVGRKDRMIDLDMCFSRNILSVK